ncbi:MAG: cation:dicarboxylase symporter family transporter, partial [Gemmatimonadetes bacterium]|nr:cation:dicarboxylase symporter family transporter [Gemmatimonadota bacterium]
MQLTGPWYMRLHWQVFIAMLLGIAAGLAGGEAIVPNVAWLGTLFVRLLKMVIVPLVAFSIISGVASVGAGASLGRLFGKTLGYYVLSSLLAIIVGLLLVNLIRPGDGANIVDAEAATIPELETPGGPADLLMRMVPVNVIDAAAKPDMLAVIFFCILFGIAISALPKDPRETMTGFFSAGFAAMMKLTSGVIRFAPIGVFGLITKVVGLTGFASFKALGLYMLTIAAGLSIHMFLTLPLLLVFLGRIN